MTDLSERRLVVFPDCDALLGKFAGVKSPCCIEVKSSAVFNVSILLFIFVAKPVKEKCLRSMNRSFRANTGSISFWKLVISFSCTQSVCILRPLFPALHTENLERLCVILVPKRISRKATYS